MDVMIGIDPHKGSHTATMLDRAEREVKRIKVRARAGQVGELLAWADGAKPRTWAVESAQGMGYLLAQQLVAPARRWWMCQRRCRRGCGCSVRASRPRPTPTTPARSWWRRCMRRRSQPCARLTIGWCVGWWCVATAIWPAGAPSCATGSTRWWPSSSRAGSARKGRQPGSIPPRRGRAGWSGGLGTSPPSARVGR